MANGINTYREYGLSRADLVRLRPLLAAGKRVFELGYYISDPKTGATKGEDCNWRAVFAAESETAARGHFNRNPEIVRSHIRFCRDVTARILAAMPARES